MITTIRRKLLQRRRRIARPRLAYLLRWMAAHAMAPYTGARVDARLMTRLADEVAEAVTRLANTGALAYFGIRDSLELGAPPIRLYMVSDGVHPYGTCVLDVGPMAQWIIRGGARSQGWSAPGRVTIADLLGN